MIRRRSEKRTLAVHTENEHTQRTVQHATISKLTLRSFSRSTMTFFACSVCSRAPNKSTRHRSWGVPGRDFSRGPLETELECCSGEKSGDRKRFSAVSADCKEVLAESLAGALSALVSSRFAWFVGDGEARNSSHTPKRLRRSGNKLVPSTLRTAISWARESRRLSACMHKTVIRHTLSRHTHNLPSIAVKSVDGRSDNTGPVIGIDSEQGCIKFQRTKCWISNTCLQRVTFAISSSVSLSHLQPQSIYKP